MTRELYTYFTSTMLVFNYSACAPLTRKEEFAAVTVPCGLMKAALSLAICSGDDGRIPLSLEMMFAFPGTLYSNTSANRPDSWAFAALLCERNAKSSCNVNNASRSVYRQ